MSNRLGRRETDSIEGGIDSTEERTGSVEGEPTRST
ncbi:hypothetical protein HALLA_16755 [Halostagnicola larsenii XH-48]|uniref:Uncharacterized protein n=1 Tax=Halostagnicola larsenii XH-48 TaxID=797299 RepID=W0JVL4_9EURY|nr:hypothetical protein HALLA_16755 [Halostagnicola larsenii XH-48]